MTIPSPASVVVDRRVEWQDTDAAGHYHHSTVIRWVEAAEAVLAWTGATTGSCGSEPTRLTSKNASVRRDESDGQRCCHD